MTNSTNSCNSSNASSASYSSINYDDRSSVRNPSILPSSRLGHPDLMSRGGRTEEPGGNHNPYAEYTEHSSQPTTLFAGTQSTVPIGIPGSEIASTSQYYTASFSPSAASTSSLYTAFSNIGSSGEFPNVPVGVTPPSQGYTASFSPSAASTSSLYTAFSNAGSSGETPISAADRIPQEIESLSNTMSSIRTNPLERQRTQKMREIDRQNSMGTINKAGVSEVQMKVANRYNNANRGQGASARYSVATSNNGVWSTIDTHRKVTTQRGKDPIVGVTSDDSSRQLANGVYVVVKMVDGETRMALKKPDALSQHSEISGQALNVLYAGEATFKDGICTFYTNRSGTYLPKEEDHAQFGFEGQFIPHIPD